MNTEAEISAAAGAHEPSGAPIMHKQLSQLVVARLREAILSGAYAPGERLVEGRLAEELEVSRTGTRLCARRCARWPPKDSSRFGRGTAQSWHRSNHPTRAK
jgi:hypothetical protein